MLKRLFSIFAISLIITGSFFEGYSVKYPVYASSWESCDTLDEQVEAFKAYCKSRDLTIEGSALDQVTSFTTKTYQNILNVLGLNMNQIQAEVKQSTDGNTGIKFLFSATGADLFNRIFSQFLQDNELAVGDTANQQDNTVYSGYYVDGYFVFVTDVTSGDSSHVIEYGTDIMSYNVLKNLPVGNAVLTITLLNNNFSFDVTESYTSETKYTYYLRTNNTSYSPIMFNRYYQATSGNQALTVVKKNLCLMYNTSNDKLYFALEGEDTYNSWANGYSIIALSPAITLDTEQSIIFLTTNNNTINNNTYNNNTYTIINNEGDVYNYGDNDEPSPDLPTPDDPTPDEPNPDLPNGNGWDDFTLPEMPNDWLIYGMEKKFPFDIPFNILFALSLLNHEPVIPRFTGDIDLKVCNWHYDINLEPFDDVAKIVRKFEVLAFIIGLAILTKNLINWG